ncbi:MAG: DUF1622 domain-containing protein [Bacteroidetes bacterium]|nr:DUF1622 domain-containing protein [Bacteroidota bacterium]
MESLKTIVEQLSKILEAIGVVIIVLGILFFLIKFLISLLKEKSDNFKSLKMGLGKSILIGLEVLIAADIIHTVIIDPTLNQVFALGIIVLIRTFLSLSLQVELDGRFPWQKKN